jgi:hypothetical protein
MINYLLRRLKSLQKDHKFSVSNQVFLIVEVEVITIAVYRQDSKILKNKGDKDE